jgi:hypothetical protein
VRQRIVRIDRQNLLRSIPGARYALLVRQHRVVRPPPEIPG